MWHKVDFRVLHKVLDCRRWRPLRQRKGETQVFPRRIHDDGHVFRYEEHKPLGRCGVLPGKNKYYLYRDTATENTEIIPRTSEILGVRYHDRDRNLDLMLLIPMSLLSGQPYCECAWPYGPVFCCFRVFRSSDFAWGRQEPAQVYRTIVESDSSASPLRTRPISATALKENRQPA